MIFPSGYNKVFSNYCKKKEFVNETKKAIFESIEEISNKTIRNQVEKNGLNKLHHFFSADYLPFLAFLLKERLNKFMYKQIYLTSDKDLAFKNKTFYIDETINYRIHYPFEFARRSRLTRQVYRSLNLKNYKNVDEELNEKTKNHAMYKMQKSDIDRDSYFGKLPEPLRGHSPHRDTWFGHTFGALNLWWSIAGVTMRTGVILYNQTDNYQLQHEKNPAYLKKDKHYLGKTKVISLEDGELLVFDPEILHASRIITTNQTRIVFSGRINKNKPKFYKKSGDLEFPFWLKSDDFKNKNYGSMYTFYRKDNSINPEKQKILQQVQFKKIFIKKKLRFKNKYKIFRINKISRNENYKIIFNNYEISFIFRGGRFYAFKSKCPHLGFDLSLGHFEKSIVTCPGHGLKIDVSNGRSECKLFKIKVFKVYLKNNYYYLQT